ncbi:acyl carrier protein phosphodiesterase [Myroides sp. LJL115]
MNFLAHIFLSKDITPIQIGNFIADSVRGKQYKEYPKEIQQGIILHRHIDTFTDTHPIWRQSKKRIVPKYNHYAAVIIDMYYDYFLAKNWSLFSSTPLKEYSQNFYKILEDNFELLPQKVQHFYPIMIRENWLLKYQSIEGLHYILSQMDRRTKGVSKMSLSTNELELYHEQFEKEFFTFFHLLQEEVNFFIEINDF